MLRASPVALSPSAKHTSRKRKFTRDQLLKSLQIVGPLTAPLPPELPPSPSPSRSSSPAPGAKRKHSADLDLGQNKKHRPNAPPEQTRHQQPSHPHPHAASRSLRPEPAEDGELRDELPASARSPATVVSSSVPVRRPRRGSRLSLSHYEAMHDKYHRYGRMLKYSGDARLWSTYPPSNADYKPLLNPPHPSSPYHKYGHLIARLELLDALICFTYAIWSKDYGRKFCWHQTWDTIWAFHQWCKIKWTLPDTDECEKAFLGIIWMIEAFVTARKFHWSARMNRADIAQIYKQLLKVAAEQADAALVAKESRPQPPMLPSPVSVTAASSANSTPTTRPVGTPDGTNMPGGAPVAPARAPPPAKERPVVSHINFPVNGRIIEACKDENDWMLGSAQAMEQCQRLLTLPIMAKHFPRTFARMMSSTLSATDEHEPDFEDEEGELFWPGQCVTGDGIGWVCTMGKAMITEFGKKYGYLGIDGVIPKPEDGAVETPSSREGRVPTVQVIPVQR